MARVLDAGIDAGIPVGTLTVQAGDVDDRVERGFDYLFAGKDMAPLTKPASAFASSTPRVPQLTATERDCFARVERSWIVRTKRKDGKQAIDGEPG